MNANDIIQHLELQPHVEGGFFKRTYEASNQSKIPTANGARLSMSSIFYLLSQDAPNARFHRNTSDIVHYFHAGDAIEYFLISPQGELETTWLGNAMDKHQQLQLIVPGGWWKASQLATQGEHGYGLLSEAVTPGFEYEDMQLGERSQLLRWFPQHRDIINRYTP